MHYVMEDRLRRTIEAADAGRVTTRVVQRVAFQVEGRHRGAAFQVLMKRIEKTPSRFGFNRNNPLTMESAVLKVDELLGDKVPNLKLTRLFDVEQFALDAARAALHSGAQDVFVVRVERLLDERTGKAESTKRTRTRIYAEGEAS